VAEGKDPALDQNLFANAETEPLSLLPQQIMNQLWNPNWQTREQAIHLIIDNLHQYVKTP
jgi:hypothetical protein